MLHIPTPVARLDYDSKSYSKRAWLNKDSSASTGSVAAFHGETIWREKPDITTFFEVSDCHCKARLHRTESDNMVEFIAKIRLLASNAEEFATFLEGLPVEGQSND
jgi:hypothetical protein